MFEFRCLYCAHAKWHAPFPFIGLLVRTTFLWGLVPQNIIFFFDYFSNHLNYMSAGEANGIDNSWCYQHNFVSTLWQCKQCNELPRGKWTSFSCARHSTAFPRKAFLLGPVKSTYCQRTKGTLVIHSPPPLPSHTHTHIHKHTHTYTNTHTHTQTHTHAHPPPFINCITVMQTENKVGLGTRLTFSPSLLKNGPWLLLVEALGLQVEKSVY